MTTNTCRTQIMDRKIDLYRNTMYNYVAPLEYTLAEGNASLRTWFPWEGWFYAGCRHHPFRLKDMTNDTLGRAASSLREAGQPVITIDLEDLLDLGQEFFRWEIAIAKAGASLGINAFDQPNVQESKDNTNRVLATVQK